MDYADFTGPDATTDNMGGTTNRIFWAPKRYFTTIQDVKALDDPTLTNLAELAEITTAHVFEPGKGAHELYCTLDKGSVDYNSQGELDGRSFKGSLKGFTPGLDPGLLGLFRMAKNDLIIAWPELPDGKLMQLGSKRFFASMIVSKIGTATNSSGVRGTDWEISFMESGVYMYNASLMKYPA
jgi:hypothetical protein